MALPHIIKHIYNNGTDEVIRRGKKIHSMGFVELVEHDELMGGIVFRVKDDSYSTFYKVYIQKYADAKLITLRCAVALITSVIYAGMKLQHCSGCRIWWIKICWVLPPSSITSTIQLLK